MLISLKENEIARGLISSALAIILIVVIRIIAIRSVRKHSTLSIEAKRQWVVFIRNTSFILILSSVVVIWAYELRTFALSIAAIAVAIVLATKEVIVSITGGFFRTSAKLFKIGDRIQSGDFRGDVIDMDFFSTTLYEVGPGTCGQQYTGKTVRLPNSYFLDKPVVNETPSKYSLHTFKVPLPAGANIQELEQEILSISTENCAPYLDSAVREIKRYTDREAIANPTIEPRVTFSVTDRETIQLVLRVPVPALGAGRIEEKILKAFLSSEAYRSNVLLNSPRQ